MAAKKTGDLVKLVEKRAAEANAWSEAQQLITQGADIKAPTKNGSMIDSVTSEANRYQQTSPEKAKNCQKLIQVLQTRASDLLATSVLSNDGVNLAELSELLRLRGNSYQSEKFGLLGLLGELLKQVKIPIRLDVVKFLIENDLATKFAVTRINEQRQTYLSLANNNPKCSQDVKQFIQYTFDMILNQIPITHPQTDVNEVAAWIYRGANPEAVDKQGNTVLSNAVLANNQLLVIKLLGVGCNILHVNSNNLTPLQMAQNAIPRNAQLEAILKAQIINYELKQLIETKKSLLTFDEVNALLEKGAKINTPLANNNTFLHLLIANEGTPEMVTAFINDFNADISAMDINGCRPVELCILLDKNPFNVLQTYFKLPKISVDTFFNIKLNKSILQFAKEQNRPEAAKIIQDVLNLSLWKTIAWANTNDEHNRSLVPGLNQLIGYGGQIEHIHSDEEYEKWTILHLACKKTTKAFVQFLVEQLKVNYALANGNGDYPLSIAAEYGHRFIVQYLHESFNVPLNISNKDKQTPLHLATKNHHLLVVRYLVLWGADHTVENVAKQTPLDVAQANTSNNKRDEIVDKMLISFLEQLICPEKDQTDQQQDHSTKPSFDLDTCELAKPITIGQIETTTLGDEERLGKERKGIFSGNANDNLLFAAREGTVNSAKTAIGEGANICYRKNVLNAYEIATKSITEYQNQSTSSPANSADAQRYKEKMKGCQQIAEDIRQIAKKRLVQGIDESVAYRVVAYHQAGAPLSADLLMYCCNKSDNVQIVDYLINQSTDIFKAMFTYSTSDSPYRVAQKKKFNNVAAYLKYRLSLECSKAILAGDIEYVKKLIRAGANVDMYDTNNLQVAIGHRNLAMIDILCENGAKMPIEWLQSKTVVLPANIAQMLSADVVFRLNRSLINRRLRLAAASGDLSTLSYCQRLSADINSMNCYGSTALLCSIQHGNYFSIVHALVSHGASVLHGNENESMSLIALAKKHNYTQITDYLSQKLNAQFLVSILYNDIRSAVRFEELGADFNYRDEQNRTALHYAVQYHGIELVTWLCDRGSTPTIADINGNYPITEATEKGDYAVVALFATKYPATKQQKNKAGLTALQIAEKQGFKRIAYILETGRTAPDSIVNVAPTSGGPKYTNEQLSHAANNGHLKIIKEFIDDRYESRDAKRHLCGQLMNIAKAANQYEVFNILQSYFNNQLKAELPSDVSTDSGLGLNQRYKTILVGFLTGLSTAIAESPVVLDPADPNTYKDLISNLTDNQKKRAEEIHKVDSEQRAKEVSEQDGKNIDEKLQQINDALNQMHEEKEKLNNKVEETSQKLKRQEKMTAIQLQDLYKELDADKKQRAAYESSLFLLQLTQEATKNKRNTVKFFREQENTNLYLFFQTIENLLQTLFIGALSAQSGLFTMEKESTSGTISKLVDKLPTSILPFVEAIGGIKSKVAEALSKLDEEKQKTEYYNIAKLGYIEELGQIASDTASLLTLYYKEQILSIDTTRMVVESNTVSNQIKWIKDTFTDVRPEGNEVMPVVIVAEYITAFVVEILKGGKKYLNLTKPLPQQLWLRVAQENFVAQDSMTGFTDIIGATVGRQKIPLKIQKGNGEKKLVHVELRYLLGCVSVVTEKGQIYQYDVSNESSNKDLADLELFGYVYVTPFLHNDESIRSIIDGRNLKEASRDNKNNIVKKLKDIQEYVKNFESQDDSDKQLAITTETAQKVAEVLREQKTFVDKKYVKSLLDESQEEIEKNVAILRADIQEKVDYYQVSIEATSEKLLIDVAEAKETLKKDNEKHYNATLQNINAQFEEIQKNLVDRIMERMAKIEKQFETKCSEMRKIVDEASLNSNKALEQATKAVQTSDQSTQYSKQAREEVEKLAASAEKERKDFQDVMAKCKSDVKDAIINQTEICKQDIIAVRTKVQQDVERTKQLAEQSATNSKESAQAAKESAKSAQETQKDTRKQLDLQKEETHKIISEAKDITKQNERSADDAKEATKQAKQAVDASMTALKKADEMHKKMESALERLEKLSKKLETN